jgi:hypothetical protein
MQLSAVVRMSHFQNMVSSQSSSSALEVKHCDFKEGKETFNL